MEQEKTLQEYINEINELLKESKYFKDFSDWRKQWLKDNTTQSLQKEV